MILGENPGVEAILAALPDDLETTVDGEIVEARGGDAHWYFRSLWIGEGYPSDYFRAGDRDSISGITDVVTARRISKGTRQLLRPMALSWADLSGRASIRATPALVIERGSTARVDPQGVELKWSDSSGAVAECVLALHGTVTRDPHRPINAGELAKISEYSYPQVNKVLQSFEAAGYIVNVGAERGSAARRILREPDRLLGDWSRWYAQRSLTAARYHTLWRDSDQSVDLIEHLVSGNSWAVSGWWAAHQVAPFATAIPTVNCYVDRLSFRTVVDRLESRQDVEQVESGGRLTVISADPQVLALASRDHGTPLVHPVRLYGDLLRLGDRGEEAAQHLRETIFER